LPTIREILVSFLTTITKKLDAYAAQRENNVAELQELLDTIYVDSRRHRQVEALDAARELVKKI
jgi:hypothetical protein